MGRKLLTVVILLLIMAGCVKKEYKFIVSDDVIIFDQTDQKFSTALLDDFVTLTYGEEKQDLSSIEVIGNVDLSKINNYPITLKVDNSENAESVDIIVSIIDRQKPEFHIFESELLVHIDEEIEINSKNFLINLTDGINGQINDRIEVIGDYDLSKVGVYQVKLLGKDVSGNEVLEDIVIRVTDIIEEKALYLYKKAIKVTQGEVFVFSENNENLEIINLQDSLNLFTPTHRNQFLWFAGVDGTYNPKQSGANVSFKDGKYFADYSKFEQIAGYQNTKLRLQQEVDNYRHYVAESLYVFNEKEQVRLTKFSIRKIDGVWFVDEFYLQY